MEGCGRTKANAPKAQRGTVTVGSPRDRLFLERVKVFVMKRPLQSSDSIQIFSTLSQCTQSDCTLKWAQGGVGRAAVSAASGLS